MTELFSHEPLPEDFNWQSIRDILTETFRDSQRATPPRVQKYTQRVRLDSARSDTPGEPEWDYHWLELDSPYTYMVKGLVLLSTVDIPASLPFRTEIDLRNGTRDVTMMPGGRPFSTSDGMAANVPVRAVWFDDRTSRVGDDPEVEKGESLVLAYRHVDATTAQGEEEQEPVIAPLRDLFVEIHLWPR